MSSQSLKSRVKEATKLKTLVFKYKKISFDQIFAYDCLQTGLTRSLINFLRNPISKETKATYTSLSFF